LIVGDATEIRSETWRRWSHETTDTTCSGCSGRLRRAGRGSCRSCARDYRELYDEHEFVELAGLVLIEHVRDFGVDVEHFDPDGVLGHGRILGDFRVQWVLGLQWVQWAIGLPGCSGAFRPGVFGNAERKVQPQQLEFFELVGFGLLELLRLHELRLKPDASSRLRDAPGPSPLCVVAA
jgi:hypothetical protein